MHLQQRRSAARGRRTGAWWPSRSSKPVKPRISAWRVRFPSASAEGSPRDPPASAAPVAKNQSSSSRAVPTDGADRHVAGSPVPRRNMLATAMPRATSRADTSVVRVQPPVIVLNGISSSGKSTIARHLQLMLDDSYLTFGVDTLLSAMPTMPSPHFPPSSRSSRTAASRWAPTSAHWKPVGTQGWPRGPTRALASSSISLAGGAARKRGCSGAHRTTRSGRGHLRPRVATARRPREHRVIYPHSALLVHEGVTYDLAVDTTRNPGAECAAQIATWISLRNGC